MTPIQYFQYRRYRRFFISWFLWAIVASFFAGGFVCVLHTTRVPIVDDVFIYLGTSTPEEKEKDIPYLFSFFFILFFSCSMLCAWFPFRARVSKRHVFLIFENRNSVYKDAPQWEKQFNEVVLPQISREEIAGTLRFPTWKERKLMDPREFAFRNFVAYEILKDPEKREKQKFLVESLRKI